MKGARKKAAVLHICRVQVKLDMYGLGVCGSISCRVRCLDFIGCRVWGGEGRGGGQGLEITLKRAALKP